MRKIALSFSVLAFAGTFTAASCNTPAPAPAQPAVDAGAVSADAAPNPCAKQQEITDARMIATESGAPLVVPCP
jgi:hypothetical protein